MLLVKFERLLVLGGREGVWISLVRMSGYAIMVGCKKGKFAN